MEGVEVAGSGGGGGRRRDWWRECRSPDLVEAVDVVGSGGGGGRRRDWWRECRSPDLVEAVDVVGSGGGGGPWTAAMVVVLVVDGGYGGGGVGGGRRLWWWWCWWWTAVMVVVVEGGYGEGRRRDYVNICVPLFQASVVGDWEAVEKILSINGEFRVDLLGYAITEDMDTALHIAVFSRSIKFVENLVNRMTDEQLILQDKYGRTALFNVAGAGNVEMARVMVERCPQLLTIRADNNQLPIYPAALYGRHNIVAYLHDSALKILEEQINPKGFPLQKAQKALYFLARNTNAFKDMKSWKNSILWVQPATSERVAIKLLRKIWKNILERSSDEINDILKGPMKYEDKIKKETYPFPILFVAAELGNIKFLVELIRGYPELLWKENNIRQTIFHIAVSHRQESIYNLLYEMGSVHDIITRDKDKEGNNMLHLAGMKPKTPHEDVSGAVFQMQREMLWFKEVESKVPTYCREEMNNDGRTPLQLFTENHRDMVSEGEKWMKETANQCMVVAALVATVVFSVAFTIPGGYNQNDGLPIFQKDGPFIMFVILDAISLILSSSSILMFLSILTSRYNQEDFLVSLPKKLMIGLTTLFLSIITMMVAFSFSFFVLYRNKLISIPIIISVGAVVPVFLYMKLQFPLLVDAYRSTYSSKKIKSDIKNEGVSGIPRNPHLRLHHRVSKSIRSGQLVEWCGMTCVGRQLANLVDEKLLSEEEAKQVQEYTCNFGCHLLGILLAILGAQGGMCMAHAPHPYIYAYGRLLSSIYILHIHPSKCLLL
ncbi:hypothetical protein OSB04_013937 [Centaurea solstitialis]|uniref:PGG domain-containing protein n=1 Tax=Centaurea solstitialis TaxID=347529 RepID=A0AA38TLR2_9ASTR|nr:hypothetical protein OSB04_013937 [Centaurea solstitialis]